MDKLREQLEAKKKSLMAEYATNTRAIARLEARSEGIQSTIFDINEDLREMSVCEGAVDGE